MQSLSSFRWMLKAHSITLPKEQLKIRADRY